MKKKIKLPLYFLPIVSVWVSMLSCQQNAGPFKKVEAGDKAKVLSLIETDTSKLPSGIKIGGNIKRAYEWEDKNGKNILVISQQIIMPPVTDESEIIDTVFVINGKEHKVYKEGALGVGKQIFILHFVYDDNNVELIWSKVLKVEKCEFDLTLEVMDGFPVISDLDANRMGEIWLMLRSGCLSDVSAFNLRLLFYQDKRECEMEGYSTIDLGDGRKMKGKYNLSSCMKENRMKQYADSIWNAQLK